LTFFCRARRAVFGIALEEACVKRRGFSPSSSEAAARLERIGTEFLGGYHAALEEASSAALGLRLNHVVSSDYRGFAFEGAAMALILLDRLHLERGSFRAFLEGPGAPHVYMLHVGAGWAFARLPWLRRDLVRAMAGMDPLLRWLTVDGYGFHEGYFHWPQSIRQRVVPRGVDGYALHVFDQGLGRSLWFVEGIDAGRAAATIRSFPQVRRADLWSGVGLACAYAGGADSAALVKLRELAGEHIAAVAQGAAFAAEARRLAGNPIAHCDAACRALCHMSAEQAAGIPREEALHLPPDGEVPAYEIWRQRVQQRLAHAAERSVV
jgi:hypothetical protein